MQGCMRSAVLGLFVLGIAGVGCGGGHALEVEMPDDECYSFECPVAVGAQIGARAVLVTDYVAAAEIADARLEPPELATLTFDRERLVIAPHTAGEATLVVQIKDGDELTTVLRFEPVASTSVAPGGLPAVVVDRSHIAMVHGARVGLLAVHRSATGERLLGQGLETWEVVGGGGAFVEPTQDAGSLVRVITASTTGPLTIRAGAGPALEIEVVPTLSTRTLELVTAGRRIAPGTLLRVHRDFWADALPFTASGRYLFGDATLTATLADPSLAEVVATTARSRRVQLRAIAAGVTELAVTFDGHTVHYPVEVSP